jgi:hypothetical protein
MPSDEQQNPADQATVPSRLDEVAQALGNGPIGAFIVAGIAVALLFAGWLAFYFLLFMPRGDIG